MGVRFADVSELGRGERSGAYTHKNGPRRMVLRPHARIDENGNLLRRFTGLGTGIPLAALLFASLLGLLLATMFLGESRKNERKADDQGDKG